ncbi:MAG: TetR/AcrR family transcriptional regulator [Oscillospiraceae bacterium]|nr:TetR/AcrR family transcriptional regulator [Oscillospiraceae bacterium]
MPKVKDEYLIEKKKEIVKAAFEVCKRKPVCNVTMSDIVAETGMSQGGVYKYFNNIYSVYAALIDEANRVGDQIGRIDEVMDSDSAPEDKLRQLFGIAESFFSDMLISYNKILFELGTFCVQNPEYDKRISSETKETAVFPYLAGRLAELIVTQCKAGYFSPVVPAPDILSFVVASFDGIIRDVTMNRCYNISSSEMNKLDEKKLIGCLYISTLKLLGK